MKGTIADQSTPLPLASHPTTALSPVSEKAEGREEEKVVRVAVPVFCTCSSLLACSKMDLIASSEPVSEVRIRVVMLPVGRKL